jgi:hypothetical protein
MITKFARLEFELFTKPSKLHALNLNFLRDRLNRTFYENIIIKIDGLVKSQEFTFVVIPAKAGIQ